MRDVIIRLLQTKVFPAKNSFQPLNEATETKKDIYILKNDICYGHEYPNSYLDVYLTQISEPKNVTLVYIHGGGYTWGDKKDGDPNTKCENSDWYFKRFLKEGYDVVSVNYAFAPEYCYPTPVIQICQALEYLNTYADVLGIVMGNVILGGGSAGGQLAGQVANIITNKAYANEMQIIAPIQKESLRAVVFASALLDNERFDKTDVKVVNWLFRKCGLAYFQCKKLAGNKDVIQSDVIRHVTDQFPPSFISDGNYGTFFEQAKDLDRKLEECHVVHKLKLYPKKEAKLSHGFENIQSEQGKECMNLLQEFLKENI